jgi:hypothetical protein
MGPDDGGSKDLWNAGKLLLDYTALQPRRQPSSNSPPWEPQIVQRFLLTVAGYRRFERVHSEVIRELIYSTYLKKIIIYQRAWRNREKRMKEHLFPKIFYTYSSKRKREIGRLWKDGMTGSRRPLLVSEQTVIPEVDCDADDVIATLCRINH